MTDTQKRAAAVTAIFSALFMVAQQVGAKATRDALFLSTFAPTQLPQVMITVSVLSIAAALGMSAWISRFGPARPVPMVFGVSALLFIGEWALIQSLRPVVVMLVYLHTSVLGGIVASGFWAVVNERFDPHTAKRVVGRIGTGAAFGGIVGGIIAQRMATLVDLESMLIVLAAINIVCAIGVWRISIGAVSVKKDEVQKGPTIFTIIGRVAYLRQMASMIMLVAATTALVEYTLKSEVAFSLQDRESLVSFFAVFYTATGVATFLVQSTLVSRALKGFGLAGTIAILPGALVVTGVLAAAHFTLWPVVLICAVNSILDNSMFRSGYEPLYTPLPTEQKRPVKILIDVAFNRLGSALGAGLVMLLLFITPSPNQILIGITVVVAALALFNANKLHHGYVQALVNSLRSGAVALDDKEIVDATTRRTLSDTTQALNREELLREIQAHRNRQESKSSNVEIDDARPGDAVADSDPVSIQEDPLVPIMQDLLTSDPLRIRPRLRSGPLDTRMTALVIPLLGNPEVARDALRALRQIVSHITGQLVDALLDPEQDMLVRQRIPQVLKVARNRRASQGLFRGLSDPNFELRNACARVLSKVIQERPELGFPSEEVFEAARRELAMRKLSPVKEQTGQRDGKPELDCQHLELVCTVLGFTLDRDILEVCFRAITSGDEQLRGTGLEYLENVLPEQLRKELWPHLGIRRKTKKTARSHQQVVKELLESAELPRIKLR